MSMCAQNTKPSATSLSLANWGLRTLVASLLLFWSANAHADPPATYGFGNYGGSTAGSVVDLATGTASISYPIVLPRARGAAQPLLSLHYNHTVGFSEVGVGWSLGLPSIERKSLAGGPPLLDSTDGYELSGVPLVKICSNVSSSSRCSNSQNTVDLPYWLPGNWNVYRPLADSSYMRVFQRISSDRTWVVQYASGEILEFGSAITAVGAGLDATGGVELVSSTVRTPFRWHLVRQVDPYTYLGPKNIIIYSWQRRLSTPYEISVLTDIFYTPSATGNPSDTAQYAHHIRLNYADWTDPRKLHTHAPQWLAIPRSVVKTIDVSSNTTGTGRSQVRRYILSYDPAQMVLERPHLTNIKLEGMCATFEQSQPEGQGTALVLPSTPNCPVFGAGTTYSYIPDLKFDSVTDYNQLFRHIQFGKRGPNGVTVPADSPRLAPYSAALADVNRDGIADFVQSGSPPGQQAPGYGRVYLNAAGSAFDHDFLYTGFEAFSYTDVLGSKTALSVFGNWGDIWGVALAYRGAGTTTHVTNYPAGVYYQSTDPSSASIYDGAPLETLVFGGAIPLYGFTTKRVGGKLRQLPPPHVYGDLDGDGTVDVIYLDERAPSPTVPTTKVSFSRRKVGSGGTVDAFVSDFSTSLELRTGANAPTWVALADMDGDGALDYVTTRSPGDSQQWRYLPGRGNGRFGCDTAAFAPPGASACEAAVASPGFHSVNPDYEVPLIGIIKDSSESPEVVVSLPFATPIDQVQMPLVAFRDVNGDGRADLVKVFKSDDHTVALEVWINLDGERLRRTQDFFADATQTGAYSLYIDGNKERTRLLFGDVDGDGIDEVVICGDEECIYKTYQAKHAGLLTHIKHEGGATTSIDYYESLSSMEQEQARNVASNPWPEEGPWTRHAPTATVPVRSVLTNSNTPAPHNRQILTTFEYRDPVYDRWRNQLRGFAHTRVTSEGRAVDTKYIFEGCLDDDLAAQTSSHASFCPNPESDPAAGRNGKPAIVAVLDPYTKTYNSLTVNAYRSVTSDPGVVFEYINRVDTFLYDTSGYVPAPIQGDYFTPQQNYIPYTIPAAGTHIRRTQTYDSNCTIRQSIDWGRIGSSDQALDRKIVTEYSWPIFSLGTYALGSSYRLASTTTKYEAGGVAPLVPGVDGPVRQLTYDYDAFGHYRKTSIASQGGLAMARFHTPGVATSAPEPPSLVSNGTVVAVKSLVYDTFGNVTKRTGPSGECETADYPAGASTDFADQPTARHSWLGASCSGAELRTSFSFDRALNVIRAVTDPTGAQQKFDFDAFGRPSKSWGPGRTTAAELKSTISYSDPDAFSHWVLEKRESTTPGNESYRWTYSDNFGRPVITFAQADGSAGDAANWIAHPAAILSDRGEPKESFRPWFYQGDPATYSISAPEGEREFVASYDFMSRRTRLTRSADAHVVDQRFYHALSTDIWDAENIQGAASHQGMFSTVEHDGHGRTTRTVKRSDSGTVQTLMDYLATGEIVAVDQGDDVNASPHYLRWLRYDSFGRIVENAEPNSALSFGPSPASSGAMKAWRYGYDKSGRLVGTRDARGCGRNVSYDLIGRPLSEDYSPCVAGQAYTGPNAAGDGTEVLYRYDTPEPDATPDFGDPAFMKGRLVSVKDRGAHTRYAYDGAGRQVGVSRRIAKPVHSSALASRYTSHWFRSSSEFDDVGRVISMNPGADVVELKGDGAGTINFNYTRRGILARVDGSYGALIDSKRVAADGITEQVVFGDTEHTTATVVPDPLRRVGVFRLTQAGLGRDILNHTFAYDEVGNVKAIADGRDPDQWDAGAKPVSRTMDYDAMHRLTSIAYVHGMDTQTSPFAAEEAAADARPIPRGLNTSRVQWQHYSYDGLGNVRSVHDDAC